MNILLVGKMGSGKDYIAELLGELYGYRTHKLGYYIRKHVDELYPNLDSAQKRPYYQKYGETLRENISIDIWNDSCFQSMDEIDLECGKVVISDGRQPHEVSYWKKKGFTIIAIDVNDSVRLQRLGGRDGNNFSEESFKHSTETNAETIIQLVKSGDIEGYVINNNKDKEYLVNQIECILEEY